MSILLVGPPAETGRAAVRRLVEQGDEVRVVVANDVADLKGEGAHVALGDPSDDDLIERAGQDARTIVTFDAAPGVLEPVLEGARRAGIERIVVVTDRFGDDEKGRLDRGAVSYVVLRTGRRLLVRGPSPEAVADAIDAADDLAGSLKLDLDLTRAEGWTALGLSPR